jgi:hypothetical protein
MVGTAVYQVGFASSSQRKNRSASKPGVQKTDAPAAREVRTAAINPWIWNSGMMLRQRSSGTRPSVSPIWRADASRFLWLRGTSFGRDVVPEVWRRRAMSSGSAKPVATEGPSAFASMVKDPAGAPSGTPRRRIAMPSFSATTTEGPVSSRPTRIALAPISVR